MIERARAKPELSGVRFAVADGGRLPFADASFDLAVSLLVQPFERELLRVLAPGGWALFCYPMGPGTPIWFPTALRRAAARARGLRGGALRHRRPRRVDGRAALTRQPLGEPGARGPGSPMCVPGRDGRDCRPRAPGSLDGHQSPGSMRRMGRARKG